MDKIVEEALTNVINRLNGIDERISQLEIFFKDSQKPRDPKDLASKAQKDYLISLGGKVWNNMTKKDAGQAIDKLLAQREEKITRASSPATAELLEKINPETLGEKDIEELEKVGALL